MLTNYFMAYRNKSLSYKHKDLRSRLLIAAVDSCPWLLVMRARRKEFSVI